MKKATKWVAMGLLLVFGFAMIAEAQDEKQERGQRGQRGQRGGQQRGGQRGGTRAGGGMGGQQQSIVQIKVSLLTVEKVTDSLDVLPDQTDAIKKDVEKINSNRERVDFRALRDLSEEERDKKIAEMRAASAKRTAEMGKVISNHLLPPQDERLTEIAIQVMGVGALSDETIAKDLKITEAQKTKMKDARDKSQTKMREKMQELFAGARNRGEGGGGGFDREAMMKQFAEMRKDVEKDQLAALTKEQKDKFAKMKGEPFELPEGALRRGFGGRGRGGAGAGGGRGRGGRPGQGGGNRPARPSRPKSDDK